MSKMLSEALGVLPLMAILRGLAPERAAGIAARLVDAGFHAIEVPLNGAGACDAIRAVRKTVPAHVVVGAGTVLTRVDADAARDAGATFLVMPNLNADVMRHGKSQGLALMPGVLTPSEAFAALDLGAFALKLFPAEVMGYAGLKALRSVLPKSMATIYPVSGIDADAMLPWREAGADGFGVGSSLFKPSFSDEEISWRASVLVSACRKVMRKET